MHILWRIHAALPAQFITMSLIQMWRRALVNVLCFPPRPLTRLELGPTASWWPAERPRPCLMPSPPCPCWRTSTWLPASPHPPCALCWAGKSPAIMGLRSHPTTSTWEMSASPWATWPATSSRACCPRPRTGECWARASHSSASLRRCSWHGGGLKMPTSNPNNQPRGTGICSHSLMELRVQVQILFSPAFFPLFSSPRIISDLSSFLSCSAKVRLHW